MEKQFKFSEYSNQLIEVLNNYPKEQQEDVRKLVVLAQCYFRDGQKSHSFTDETGDLFLQNSLKSL
jgi:hypothetical protein